MRKMNDNNPNQNDPIAGFSRRYFLIAPAAVAGLTILDPVFAATPKLSFALVEENLTVGDSLTLYVNLLPGLKKTVFDEKLEGIGLLKELASGGLQQLINSAKVLGDKHRTLTATNPETLFADFRRLVNSVTDIYAIREIIDQSRNELPDLMNIDRRIETIRGNLLSASSLLSKATDLANPQNQLKLAAEAKAKLDDAINNLKGFLKSDVDETRLTHPAERMILLIRGAQFAIDQEFPEKRRHHAMPASSIMQTLRKHVTPGSWLQLGIGYAVAFPVLLRNSDRQIREKLLMDGLRLVPGLVPWPLVDAAKELSGLTL
jgi:hypothetical protein